jgi:hypothetical protein
VIAAVTIEWGKLVEAALVSAVFGIGVILVGTIGVVASLRAQDRRLAQQSGAAVLNAVTYACVLGIAAAVVLAIYVMADK